MTNNKTTQIQNKELLLSYQTLKLNTYHDQQNYNPFTVDLPLNEDVLVEYKGITLPKAKSTLIDVKYHLHKSFESFIIDTIHQDDSLSLTSKLNFTRILLSHYTQLRILSEDFYEEECHLSLLNWIWKVKHLLKSHDALLINNNSNTLL